MLEVVFSGLVTGWAIAVPIGAVGAFLVTLTARTSFRVGAAGALGIATVDGMYAALAVVAGAALSAALAPVATPLRIVSGVVLLVVAGLTAAHALATSGRPRESRPVPPARAYALFLAITAVNPTTVVYFAAVVLGNRDLVDTPAQAAVFVLAAFAASALLAAHARRRRRGAGPGRDRSPRPPRHRPRLRRRHRRPRRRDDAAMSVPDGVTDPPRPARRRRGAHRRCTWTAGTTPTPG